MVMLRTRKDSIMELWIRSQNKNNLVKVNALYTDIPDDFGQTGWGIYCEKQDNYRPSRPFKLGQYDTKERALEVLDEIQNEIKTLLYLKPKAMLRQRDLEEAKEYYQELNKVDFITTNINFEIEPISNNVFVYEMPKE